MSAPTPLPVPKSAQADAWQRAVRSYVGGLVAAVFMAAAPLLEASAGNIHWSTAWWAALGNALISPALYAVVAYVGRHKVPPA